MVVRVCCLCCSCVQSWSMMYRACKLEHASVVHCEQNCQLKYSLQEESVSSTSVLLQAFEYRPQTSFRLQTTNVVKIFDNCAFWHSYTHLHKKLCGTLVMDIIQVPLEFGNQNQARSWRWAIRHFRQFCSCVRHCQLALLALALCRDDLKHYG